MGIAETTREGHRLVLARGQAQEIRSLIESVAPHDEQGKAGLEDLRHALGVLDELLL